MTLFEVVLQGIRNFNGITRISLKPNLNIVQGDNGRGKSTFLDAIIAILFGPSWTHTPSLLPKNNPSTCQGGVILKSVKGGIFRLTRDFTNKRQSLSKLDPSRKFIPLEKEDPKILQMIQEELQGLRGEDLEKISILRRSGLPSSHSEKSFNHDRPKEEETIAGSDPAFSQEDDSKTVQVTYKNPEEKKKRLSELKAMLAKAEEVAQIEELLSDSRDKVSDLQRRLRLWNEKNQELKNIKTQEENFAGFEQFPANLDSLIDAHEEGLRQQQPILGELEEEKTALLNGLVNLPETNFLQNKFLWVGGGIILVNLSGGLILNLQGALRHLFPLGFAVGLGFIIWSFWQDRANASKRNQLHDDIDRLYKKQEQMEEKFQKEHAQLLELLKKSGCQNTKELRDKTRSFRNLIHQREDCEQMLANMLQGKSTDELNLELKEGQKKMEGLQSKASNLSSIPIDLISIQDEIRLLEKEGIKDETTTRQTPTPPRDPQPTPSPNLGVIPEMLVSQLDSETYQKIAPYDEASIFTTANTLLKRMIPDKQWEISRSQEGSIILKDPAGGPVSWDQVSSGSLDLIWALLFLSSQGLLKGKHPFPLLLDDPFIGMDTKRQAGLMDILRAMGRNRQIILCTTQTPPIKEGDHQVML